MAFGFWFLALIFIYFYLLNSFIYFIIYMYVHFLLKNTINIFWRIWKKSIILKSRLLQWGVEYLHKRIFRPFINRNLKNERIRWRKEKNFKKCLLIIEKYKINVRTSYYFERHDKKYKWKKRLSWIICSSFRIKRKKVKRSWKF